MYRLEREEFVQAPYVSLWSILGFQAGYINAFGFLACGRYVSHVTGFGTQIGMAIANSSIFFALELLGFPLSFIFGSFFSALLTSARIERKQKPLFVGVSYFFSLVLLSLILLGKLGLFGTFGEQLIQAHDFVLLFLLSFVCGMQNGCFATLTKGQIRTTHLTGISTDIGTDLARIWFGKLSPPELDLTKKINMSRIVTVVSFALGSILSVLMSRYFAYGALTVPFATSLVVLYAVHHIIKELGSRPRAELLNH